MLWKGALRCAPSSLVHALAASPRATAAASVAAAISSATAALTATHTGVIVPTDKAF